MYHQYKLWGDVNPENKLFKSDARRCV